MSSGELKLLTFRSNVRLRHVWWKRRWHQSHAQIAIIALLELVQRHRGRRHDRFQHDLHGVPHRQFGLPAFHTDAGPGPNRNRRSTWTLFLRSNGQFYFYRKLNHVQCFQGETVKYKLSISCENEKQYFINPIKYRFREREKTNASCRVKNVIFTMCAQNVHTDSFFVLFHLNE